MKGDTFSLLLPGYSPAGREVEGRLTGRSAGREREDHAAKEMPVIQLYSLISYLISEKRGAGPLSAGLKSLAVYL